MISIAGFLKPGVLSCVLFFSCAVLIAQAPIPEMILVPGGTFKMGSVAGGKDEQPVHKVTLDDFYIGKFEVSQSEWKQIMNKDTIVCYIEGCDSCPVERVSWYNVMEFIKELNRRSGMNYRLPTEAEWEYAARGGTQSRGFRYSGSNNVSAVSWNVGNAQAMTHHTGLKKPNELGIFDMSGNVYEWCSDWYSEGWYKASPGKNPKGPSTGNHRVIRGGSWYQDYSGLRITDRDSANPTFKYGYVGFRLCRSASPGK